VLAKCEGRLIASGILPAWERIWSTSSILCGPLHLSKSSCTSHGDLRGGEWSVLSKDCLNCYQCKMLNREFVQKPYELHAAFVHCAKPCDKLKNL
jgi:hypothetical protein